MTVSPLVRAAVAALGTITLLAAVPASAPATTRGTNGQPITNAAGVTFGVVAHRGGAGQWPENSLAAFEGSVAAGYDGIETDLQFTADAHPVMSHYDTVPARCTSAGKKIHQLSWSQVSKIRCADLAGDKTVPIPTFAELAAVLQPHPEVGLTLDVKSYAGQSASGMRTYAGRAMSLLKKYGLTSRTRILTYSWSTVLPTIRTASKSIYVLAYDTSTLDLDRVRRADALGASGYGVRMKNTSAYLARYVASKGLESVPWEVLGDEQRSFTIHFGGRTQLFLTDLPADLQAQLVSGGVDLDPVATPTFTPLAKPVTVSSTSYSAGVRHYPLVLGPAVPSGDLSMLDTVTLAITVTGGPGTGTLSVGPRSGTLGTVTAALPKGTSTITLTAPLGDDGKLRIYTTRTTRLTVRVTGYTRIRFT